LLLGGIFALDLLYGHFHEMTYETVLAVFEGGVAGPCYGVMVFSLLAISEGVCCLIGLLPVGNK